MKIGQDQNYEGDDWWSWSVWLDATAAELERVKKVEWHLHPTFPDPVREMTNRNEKFKLKTGGWGTFRVRAEVFMSDGKKETLDHDLQLLYPGGKPATA